MHLRRRCVQLTTPGGQDSPNQSLEVPGELEEIKELVHRQVCLSTIQMPVSQDANLVPAARQQLLVCGFIKIWFLPT